MKIAMRGPSNKDQLAAIGELSPKQISMYGDGLIGSIKRASKIAPRDLPVYPRRRSRPLKARVPDRVKALKSWRQSRSGAIGIDPALVCNNALASEIATRNPKDVTDFEETPGIRKWQVREFGEEIIALLSPLSGRT